MRATPALADLPVIALGSAVATEAVERARGLGVADFVAKFDRSGLISALAELTAPALDVAA